MLVSPAPLHRRTSRHCKWLSQSLELIMRFIAHQSPLNLITARFTAAHWSNTWMKQQMHSSQLCLESTSWIIYGVGVRKGRLEIVTTVPQCFHLLTRHNTYMKWHGHVPWLAQKIAQNSFRILVYNYRINTSELHDLSPWSRVLEKLTVTRFMKEFPLITDDELLLLYLVCPLLQFYLLIGARFERAS
jgi:hypothetical protein